MNGCKTCIYWVYEDIRKCDECQVESNYTPVENEEVQVQVVLEND
jgi:hypothetical protein